MENEYFRDISLLDFTRELWSIREPATKFQNNWVMGALTEHLTACYERQIKKLCINIFFRSGKSNEVCVFFPAWVWTKNPAERFLFASFSGEIALRDAYHCRQLIESEPYQKRYGHLFKLASDQSAKGFYENDKTGARRSIGTQAQVTGHGGGIKVLDDPNDTNQVESSTIREGTNGWFDNFVTRSDDFSSAVTIVIQQRTHPKDVTGHIQELGGLGYEFLVIPLEYDGRKTVTSLGWVDPRTVKGEIADPVRFPEDEVKNIKASLAYRYHGQAQQLPISQSGSAIKREWYEPYITELDFSEVVTVRLSYDIGFSDADVNDWTWGSLKAKLKDGSKVTLWQHFGHWENKPRREAIAEIGLRVKRMMEECFPNATWQITEEAGVGAGVAIIREDINYLISKGLSAKPAEIKKQAKAVRALAYRTSCENGFTKFYAGEQFAKYGFSDGTKRWILPFLDAATQLYYSDDGLQFLGGKDDMIDAEVMAHDQLDKRFDYEALESPMIFF